MIMNKKQIQEMYCQYLQREGYEAGFDEMNNVYFNYEGLNYWLMIDEREEGKYVRMLCPNMLPLVNQEEEIRALILANTINAQYKLGKIYLFLDERKNTSAEVASFLKEPEDFQYVFQRLSALLKAIIANFAMEMLKGIDNSENA
jgi:hypothetical protein